MAKCRHRKWVENYAEMHPVGDLSGVLDKLVNGSDGKGRWKDIRQQLVNEEDAIMARCYVTAVRNRCSCMETPAKKRRARSTTAPE